MHTWLIKIFQCIEYEGDFYEDMFLVQCVREDLDKNVKEAFDRWSGDYFQGDFFKYRYGIGKVLISVYACDTPQIGVLYEPTRVVDVEAADSIMAGNYA